MILIDNQIICTCGIMTISMVAIDDDILAIFLRAPKGNFRNHLRSSKSRSTQTECSGAKCFNSHGWQSVPIAERIAGLVCGGLWMMWMMGGGCVFSSSDSG